MITLNQNNSKKIFGDKYLYNLVSNENINIKKIILKSNIKKNIVFGFIGNETKYILNPIYDDDETEIELDINLLNGNNYIFINSIDINFEIIINENIELGNIKYKIFDTPYIINTSYYYDILMNQNKLYFLAYINDSANNNLYEIKINDNKINRYDKYDNFFNFIGSIDINYEQIYTLEINMKYLISILRFIIIYDNVIENKTNYNSNQNNIYNSNQNNIYNSNQNNIYNMNPIIAYKDINLNAYYLEIKFIEYNNYTRLSLDKNNKIILKIIDNILFINNKKLFKYNKNKYIKFVLNYDVKLKNTTIYIFNNLPYKREWEKVLVINNKINFYQKLFESQYYDSHINKKIVTIRKAFIFDCNGINKYIDNINFKFYDNSPTIFLNNYTLMLGGSVNKNNNLITKNEKLNIINDNNPLTNNTIDIIGIKLIKECFNNNIKIQNKRISENDNINASRNNNIINNISNSNGIKPNNINNNLNKVISQPFMFDFTNKSLMDLLKAFLIITILILLAIKICNR